jgi:aromatic ring-opening dioxygenase catalytic subunit (LigB family)
VRSTTSSESRGQDGRGFAGPGLDHGVFVPFRLMFGENFMDIPIVQVSIDASMDPAVNWEVGTAIAKLRLVQLSTTLTKILKSLFHVEKKKY